ncbi:protein gamma response 1 isoform X1 [Nicotiana tabacum]|uniref:Protein gamma response 1 isoform X1 n=3 Tax=Nicotiana tabacum TaxID=4097 RepID=A0A1S4B1D6_TOBAC|nr:protein gamma response 1 isoform X1 [Nicotiana tomentosiformis]XP_016482750.1 PREDICTED: protein gamma response 1-like isoform X1 [Nicotiana tabacum]
MLRKVVFDMAEHTQQSPQTAYPANIADAKYVSGLSTILVATIQEAKDRISQIEYIFCSQLFPNYQSKSQSLQLIYSEARNAAETSWKEKEKDLLLQMENMQLEKQKILQENQSLKLEKTKLLDSELSSANHVKELQNELKQRTSEINNLREAIQRSCMLLESRAPLVCKYENPQRELEDRVILLMKKQQSSELEVGRLQLELQNKSMEVDGGLELHNKLVQLAQSKTSSAAYKEKQLKEYEQKMDKLLAELETTQRRVDKLKEELKDKTAAVEKGLEMQENLLSKVQLLDAEIMKNEDLLNQYKNEKQLLMTKAKNLETDVYDLQKELMNKKSEAVERRKLHDQLLQQIDLYSLERSKTGQELEELEKEKKKLLAKLRDSEEEIDKLQANLRERSKDSSEGMELHGKLLHLIQAKESELLAEKNKRKDMVTSYKSLKSQYNFLCARYGLTSENMHLQSKLSEQSALQNDQSPLTSREVKHKVPEASGFEQEDKHEVLDNDKGVSLIPRSNSVSPPISSALVAPKNPANVKSCPPAGTKRPVSYWRDTRSHQSRVGPDPHDDFLDTPLENVRGNLGKVMKDEVQNHPKPNPKDTKNENSDDETQDMNVDNGPKKQQMLPPTRSGATGFKYIEPVRKKAERENLKGVECQQCKKFYDAVLPGEDKDSNGNRQNLRCEHHDGVSRHRYRYAPPLTPEGFWNIGFESEM